MAVGVVVAGGEDSQQSHNPNPEVFCASDWDLLPPPPPPNEAAGDGVFSERAAEHRGAKLKYFEQIDPLEWLGGRERSCGGSERLIANSSV